MLELAPYGLTGLVAILLVAFCFACKDDTASFSYKHSSRSMDDAELRHPNSIERCMCAADSDAEPNDQTPGIKLDLRSSLLVAANQTSREVEHKDERC
jgi:hypothetical protein